jgi:hypothetical protein
MCCWLYIVLFLERFIYLLKQDNQQILHKIIQLYTYITQEPSEDLFTGRHDVQIWGSLLNYLFFLFV